MVIFGLIWSGGNNFKASIGIVNEDNSKTSQAITQAFQKISSLTVETGNQEDLVARLKKGELRAVIIVPATMEANIANGNPVDIQVYYDPSNTTTTQVILPMVNQVVEGIGQQVSRHPSVFQLHAQSIQSHQMRSIDYLVPGIIAMSIMSTGLFCALPLIQQREKKILKRWGATPIHRSSIIYSQVVFRLVLSILQTALLVFIAHAIFNVQMVGNWAVLFGVVALGALVLISIGYLVASFVKTQEGAMPIIQLVQFPMMFLSRRDAARFHETGSGNNAIDLPRRFLTAGDDPGYSTAYDEPELDRTRSMAGGLCYPFDQTVQVGIALQAFNSNIY